LHSCTDKKISNENVKNIKWVEVLRHVYTCNFCWEFLLLTDVNEWISNECSEYMLLHLNICGWSTQSHPSKGGKSCRCKDNIDTYPALVCGIDS
jgi:hypothetical protein